VGGALSAQSAAAVIWITGLSGAGKSTLAREVARLLRGNGQSVVLLDGDELRDVFSASQAHDRDSRLSLAMQYAHLCKVIAEQQLTVVIATISLFKEVHEWNRAHLPGYFEVYLDVPVEELRRRDPKGIYRRFEAGEVRDVAGMDLLIDEPKTPDFLLKSTDTRSPADVAAELVDEFRTARIMPSKEE